MKELIPLISEKYDGESITLTEYETVLDILTELWDEMPENSTLNLEKTLIEETGEVYRDMMFKIEARYRRGRNQDRYFSGGGFELNLDNMLRKMKERVK